MRDRLPRRERLGRIRAAETTSQWIRKVTLRDPRSGAHREAPVMCQHCAEPPCVDVCPTGASFKRADGIVLVDKHICIGCRYCMMACPLQGALLRARDHEDQKPWAPRGKGTVEGCTMCVAPHRRRPRSPPAPRPAPGRPAARCCSAISTTPKAKSRRRCAKRRARRSARRPRARPRRPLRTICKASRGEPRWRS